LVKYGSFFSFIPSTVIVVMVAIVMSVLLDLEHKDVGILVRASVPFPFHEDTTRKSRR